MLNNSNYPLVILKSVKLCSKCCVLANERNKNDVYCNSKGPANAYTTDINSYRPCAGK